MIRTSHQILFGW